MVEDMASFASPFSKKLLAGIREEKEDMEEDMAKKLRTGRRRGGYP